MKYGNTNVVSEEQIDEVLELLAALERVGVEAVDEIGELDRHLSHIYFAIYIQCAKKFFVTLYPVARWLISLNYFDSITHTPAQSSGGGVC